MAFSPLLLTDRYQLTMLAAYAESGLAERRAVFELFVRRLPPSRRYLVACGIGRAVPVLADLVFSQDDLASLAADSYLGPTFDRPKVRALFEGFKFRAKIHAIPEGRMCFPGEPLVRVKGTLAEAQLVETLLLSIVNHDTRVASKCARIVHAAAGRPCYEFGSRRTHEGAAVDAARAAYIAGFAGTSNELARARYGIPIAGTMAHSFVLAHAADEGEAGEATAFASLNALFPSHPTFLVDTFDTLQGVSRAMDAAGDALGGVRLDSGDLGALSKEARKMLDGRGLVTARVFASDDLDEVRIKALLDDGAPIATFGVGTMAVSTPDAPSLGGVYKLVAMEDAAGRLVAVQKRGGKGSSAGPKQVFRAASSLSDTVGLDTETLDGEPLLVPVLDGSPVGDLSLEGARKRLARDLERAGPELLAIADRTGGPIHPVVFSPMLSAVQAEVERHGRAVISEPGARNEPARARDGIR